MSKRNLAILIYDDAEVLDFAGPFEVFSVTAELNNYRHFNVYIVAESQEPVRAINGMRVVPDFSINTAPPADILVIAGGSGSRQAMLRKPLLDWLTTAVDQTEITMSVCSGARLLAVIGELNGLEVTTHHQVFDHLAELAPEATLCPGRRFVDTGKIITTGGISAGIDASFHVVSRLLGDNLALKTAEYMEYDWTPEKSAVSSRQVKQIEIFKSPQVPGG